MHELKIFSKTLYYSVGKIILSLLVLTMFMFRNKYGDFMKKIILMVTQTFLL